MVGVRSRRAGPILVAHARNPFRGPRELLVAMGDMVRFA
ncbi:hypothetical protein SMF913_11886 [Streptomyces malaysiensis]|uniref:Uncharacterized protein n=1 Tax=Streptomyces malaysiensis TaxID=92644 RepID=A0A2J7Z6F4_STRMQ|nr:hypothetical protein SMF913_11886 [Streptomyces malaysiensis]